MISQSSGASTQVPSLDHPFWIVAAFLVLGMAVSYWNAIQTPFVIQLLTFRARREDEVPPVFFAGDPVLFEVSAGDARVQVNVELLHISADGSITLKQTFVGSMTRTRMYTPPMVIPGRYRLQVVWRPSAARARRALEPGADAAEPEYLPITDEEKMTPGERVMHSLAWLVRWVSPGTADKLEPLQRPVSPSCACDFLVHTLPFRAGARTAVQSSLEVLRREDEGKTENDVFTNLMWDEFPLQVHPSGGKALVLPCGEPILVDVQCSPYLSNGEGRLSGFDWAVVLRWCGDDASEEESWQTAIGLGRRRAVAERHVHEGAPLLEFGTKGGAFFAGIPTVSRPGRWQLGFVLKLVTGWEPIATYPVIVLAPELRLDIGPTAEPLSKASRMWWGQPLRFQALTSRSNAGDRVVLVRQHHRAWRASTSHATTPLRASLSYDGTDHHRVSKEALDSVTFPSDEPGCSEFELASGVVPEDLSKLALPADPAPLSLGRHRLGLELSGTAAATQPGHFLAFYLRYDAMRKGPCNSRSRLVVGNRVILSDAPSSIVYPACMDSLVASGMLEARGPRIFAADTRGIYVQDDRRLWPERADSETATSVIGPLHTLLCDDVVGVPWGAAITACFKASPLASKSDSIKLWRIGHPGSAVSAPGRIFAATGPSAPKVLGSLEEAPGRGMCASQVVLASHAQALGHSRFVLLCLPFPGLFRLSYCIEDRSNPVVVEHSAPCVALGPSLLPLVDSPVVSSAVRDSTSARGTSVPVGRPFPGNATSWLTASGEAPAPLLVKRSLHYMASGAPVGGGAGADDAAAGADAWAACGAADAAAAASKPRDAPRRSDSLVAADVGHALICRTTQEDLMPEPFFGEAVKVRWRASCWRSARDFIALVPLGQDVSSPHAIQMTLPAPRPMPDMELRSTISSTLAAAGCLVGETPPLGVLAQIDSAWWEHGDLTFADAQAPNLPGEWQFVYVCHPAGAASGGPAEVARSLPFNVRPPSLHLQIPTPLASAAVALEAAGDAPAAAAASTGVRVATPPRLDVQYTTRPLPPAGWFGSTRSEYIGVARDGEAPLTGSGTSNYKAVPSEGSGMLSFGPSELPNKRGQYQMVYFKQPWLGSATIVSRSSVKFSIEPSADQTTLELKLLGDARAPSLYALRAGSGSRSSRGQSSVVSARIRDVSPPSPDGSVVSALPEDANLDDSISVVSRHTTAQPLHGIARPSAPPLISGQKFDTSNLDSVVKGTRPLRPVPFAVAKAREWMRLGSTATEVMEQLVASGVSHQEAQDAVGAVSLSGTSVHSGASPSIHCDSGAMDHPHATRAFAAVQARPQPARPTSPSPSPGPLSMMEQVALRAKARQERVAAAAAATASGAASSGAGAGGRVFGLAAGGPASPGTGGSSKSTRPLTLSAQRAQSIELGLSSLRRSVPAFGSAAGGPAARAKSLIRALESFSLDQLGGQEGISLITKVLPSPSEAEAISSQGLSAESIGGLGDEARAVFEILGAHRRCLPDVAHLCELAMAIPEAADELATAAEATTSAATALAASRGLREFLATLGASLASEHGSGTAADEEAGRQWVAGFSVSALPPASKVVKVILALGPDALQQPPESRCSDSPVFWYVSMQPALRARRSISQADDQALARMATAKARAAELSAKISGDGLATAATAARAVKSAATRASTAVNQALDALKALAPAGGGAELLEGLRALALSVLPAAVSKARSDASRGASQAAAAAAVGSPAARAAASAQTPATPLSVSQMSLGLKAALDARRMAMRGRGADQDSDDGWSSDGSQDT